MATAYRFRTCEIAADDYRTSQRWATIEAIHRVQGEPTSEGVEVSKGILGREVDAMTDRGFDALHQRRGDFPSHVR